MTGDPRVEGYAAALFEVARAEGALDRVEDELFRFARTLERESRLREALTDIALPAERRSAMVGELLGGKASGHATNLIRFIVEQGRAREIPAIVDSLVARAAAARRRAVAEVRSAAALDGDQLDRLTEAVEAATGKQVDVKVLVDPSMIGGLLVRVGDTVFDGTARTRLRRARERLERG
ncbi:MAG: ATP synthase F1 subunit delta [Acidobacteria bacterium]|nr:ATP synthase F1 subunit delta [Acidobacteriota bacterium]